MSNKSNQAAAASRKSLLATHDNLVTKRSSVLNRIGKIIEGGDDTMLKVLWVEFLDLTDEISDERRKLVKPAIELLKQF
ncbi:MAG: hypothetical protein K1X68_07090 [Saprospiraceae bacterium]|nr:hypothetical protein [Saprospiraceae bacterium]HMW39900.1 hypothetical protein [Saprospiraceae bacterium]HMX89135.1 hypothetical protein [Saprospiraceae bacterium]HMZ40804.1 hypothetical protein [Saprospiraceae bacterium]HNA64586.1 hypothetical protein [Saprospiraceae bacterium]